MSTIFNVEAENPTSIQNMLEVEMYVHCMRLSSPQLAAPTTRVLLF